MIIILLLSPFSFFCEVPKDEPEPDKEDQQQEDKEINKKPDGMDVSFSCFCMISN